jgi:hypothetical protein
MPLLGFSEQRLDPHLPFAKGLLVGESSAIGAYPIVVVFVAVAVDGTAVLGVGASLLEYAGVADLCLGPVHGPSSGVVASAPA